jgi:hypothetical protein
MTGAFAYDRLIPMNRRLLIASILILAVAVPGGACLVRLIRAPAPAGVERAFSGDEAVFVETHGLFDLYNSLKETRYVRGEGWRPFFEVGPIRELLDKLGGANGGWWTGIDRDALMGVIGNESALGVYPGEGAARFLFVSRVQPNALLMERLFIFTQTGDDVIVTTYRDRRVKEVRVGDGHSLWYALDGDLFIFSDDRGIFFSALDRSLSGERGGLGHVPSFRRMARKRGETTLVCGFAVRERVTKIPGLENSFSGAARRLAPDSLHFSLTRERDTVSISVSGEGLWSILPWVIPEGKREALSVPPDVPVVFWVGGSAGLSGKNLAAVLGVERPVIRFAPSLFPEGFGAYVTPGIVAGRPPAAVVVGERSPSFAEALDRIAASERLSAARETASGIDVHALTKDGVPFLSWAETDGIVVLSEGPDAVAEALREPLETAGIFDYNETNDDLIIALRPRIIADRSAGSPGLFDGMFWGLSSTDVERLALTFYPAAEIDIRLSVTGGAGEATVGARVEDKLP